VRKNCENSTTVIIKGCDSAEKLFTQKILIKPLINYPKRVKLLGQELTDIGWGRPVGRPMGH